MRVTEEFEASDSDVGTVRRLEIQLKCKTKGVLDKVDINWCTPGTELLVAYKTYSKNHQAACQSNFSFFITDNVCSL